VTGSVDLAAHEGLGPALQRGQRSSMGRPATTSSPSSTSDDLWDLPSRCGLQLAASAARSRQRLIVADGAPSVFPAKPERSRTAP